MLQAGLSGRPALGHQPVTHQSVSQAGRLPQRVPLTAVHPALPTRCQVNDGFLSAISARSQSQKTPPLVQASATCRLSAPRERSNFRAQDAPFCKYIWKSGRDCRARAYSVRRSRSSSPRPRSGENGLGHSEAEDSYFQGVTAPRPLHNGLNGREPLGSREDALNGSHSQLGHLPRVHTNTSAQRSPDDGPADVARHTSSHGMVGHLGFRHKPPTAGIPAVQEESHHEVAGHILPLVNSSSQPGSGLGGALQGNQHQQNREPAGSKHDLPAGGIPHLVVEANHHQVNGHALPTLSSGPQEVLNGHSVPMVSSTTQGVPMPVGLRDGSEPSGGDGDQSEESVAQPDTRSRKELLAEISRLTEKFERAEALRITAEQINMTLRAELEGQREEFWHSRRMQHDLWRGKLAQAMTVLEKQEEEGDLRLQGEDEQPTEASDPFSAWPADDDSTDDTSGLLVLGPASSNADPQTPSSSTDGAMLALPGPTPDAGAFPQVKSTSPLKIRETAAKLVSHFMAQRPDPPQGQGNTPSAEVGLQLTSEDGPEAEESAPALDAEAEGGSEVESSEIHASPAGAAGAPGITSSLQASEAMAKFKQQLREGRTKGLLLQGKMQEGLRNFSPHPEGAHPEGDAQDAQEQPKLKGSAAPSLEAELQLVAFLHRWLLGENKNGALPRVVQKHLAKLCEQWYKGPTDLEEGGLLAGTCQPLRYLLESGQLGKSGSMSLFAGGQDLESASEVSAIPEWMEPQGTLRPKPMSMDSYLRWLVNMLVLLRQGSLTQEQAVMSLEGYFQYMNVGTTAWDKPWQVIRNAQPMFGTETREKVDTIWEEMKRRTNFFNPVPKKTRDVKKVVVFGGGSFATALAVAVARRQPDAQVIMLLRNASVRDDINTRHKNSKYLGDMTLLDNITAVVPEDEGGAAYANALKNVDYVVHAVPVQQSREFLSGIKDLLAPDVAIIAASKGLEKHTGLMMSDLIPSALGRQQPAVFISGPSFAKEIVKNMPTALVAAAKDIKLAEEIAGVLSSDTMTVEASNDVTGVEICGALKNVLAIAIGIVRGSEMGDNSMAALLTYGFADITKLVLKAGGHMETMLGPAGFGDIVMTCYGSQSRNGKVGYRLGKGETIEEITDSQQQVAEGVPTAPEVLELAKKHKCFAPVLASATKVITGCCTSKEAIAELMQLAATAPSTMPFSKKKSLQNPFKIANQTAILRTAGVPA